MVAKIDTFGKKRWVGIQEKHNFKLEGVSKHIVVASVGKYPISMALGI